MTSLSFESFGRDYKPRSLAPASECRHGNGARKRLPGRWHCALIVEVGHQVKTHVKRSSSRANFSSGLFIAQSGGLAQPQHEPNGLRSPPDQGEYLSNQVPV